jgi:GntR family transcriptional regulator/MocR family aminotransferase
MKYIIDKSKRPVYLQLYKQIREDIINGNYPYSTKLPSKRNLAIETGVSTITVEHAYALLCEEGYVESRERSGFIVIFQKSDGFASSSESYTTNASYHNEHAYPDFPISVLSKTMRKVLTEHREILLDKAPNQGCFELREAIRHYLSRNRGIHVSV